MPRRPLPRMSPTGRTRSIRPPVPEERPQSLGYRLRIRRHRREATGRVKFTPALPDADRPSLLAARSAGMQVMTRAPPQRFHEPSAVRLRTFTLLRALDTLQLGREPDVEGVCPGWASPPPDTSLDVKIPL